MASGYRRTIGVGWRPTQGEIEVAWQPVGLSELMRLGNEKTVGMASRIFNKLPWQRSAL